MATIQDLANKDIQTMSDDELREFILNARARRRNPDPELVKKAKAIAIKRKNKSIALQSTDSLLKGMSMAQLMELKKMMEER